MASFARLSTAIQYNLMVIDVRPPSHFNRAGNPKSFFSSRIIFRDKFGKEYNAQYISEESIQTHFNAGESTVFRVSQPDEKCDIVSPVFDSKQTEEKILIPSSAMPPAGTTYALSLYHSVQLMAAEKQGTMQKIDDDDIERMLKMSDRINAYMLDKQQEIISDETIA